mgnify:CR=1 FL=1|jgi:arginine decarboxylase
MKNSWSAADAAQLYAVDAWSEKLFSVSPEGEVTVSLKNNQGDSVPVSLMEILNGVRERGKAWPVLLRFGEILESRIALLHNTFQAAIADIGYQGKYHGVYPIKVNQQQEALERITRFGRRYHYGLEIGTKAELIAALAYLHDPEAYLICNGYKDAEFIDMALHAQKIGLQVVLVVEMPSEVGLILKRAEILGIQPNIGIRARLRTKSSGHWRETAGDKSVFGLHTAQVMAVVDELKAEGKLDYLKMLHYHQGSQIPDIRSIRDAALEASRIYVELVKEGAPMGLLDLGGGLAIDYDGTHSSGKSSCNYGIEEYCVDLIDVIKRVTDEHDVPHPNLITESGRAIVAHFSVLVFDILDTNSFYPKDDPLPIPENAPPTVKDFYEAWEMLNEDNIQECYNDAMYYRDQLHQAFLHGSVTLRQRSLGEQMFGHLIRRLSQMLDNGESVPEEMSELKSFGVDFYYGNFSIFQSLPDAWAIGQIFPVMPLHRLTEKPTRKAVIADITCDCDGHLDQFMDAHNVRHSLPVHELRDNEDYLMGAFLVGAYQETLGDLHNLIGDTHIVSVELNEQDKIRYVQEVQGDSVGEVLEFVEYDLKQMQKQFREFAETAVNDGRITTAQLRESMQCYVDGIRGYTYFEK